MTRLSAILITRNEAANIEACLATLGFADEIVVVDQGSIDGTAEKARALGARVHTAVDWPGFGRQKNRALDLAQGHWVLSIDADERVPEALAQEILRAIEGGGAPDAFEVPRLTEFCGQWIHHCGWTPDRVTRLFRRDRARFTDDLVHERVVTNGNAPVGRLREPLLHHSYPSPEHYWRKLQQYSHDWAVQQHERGRRTTMGRAIASAVVAFIRSYFVRLGFLDGAMGLAVCTYQAQAAYGKYFELYCLHHQDANRNT